MKRTPLKRKKPTLRPSVMHGLFPYNLAPIRAPRKPLPKQSAKRKARNAEYEAAVKQWRAGHDGRCEMRLLAGAPIHSNAMHEFRCKRKAGPRPHHMALRGPNLCNIATFMGVCQPCHDWIHDHPKEARRLGYLTK